ncbi:MAG: MBL fold metallo-hydrolase [Candidatus Omnitrophica bacterium]|nr:MBL fold metallo-hydrolase [Candidatus Omnitrophota bacterium]
MKENEIKGDVYIKRFVLGPLGSNTYILASTKTKDTCLIDPCRPVTQIRQIIKEYGFNLKCVINTHGHIDHIQANEDFNVPVYIHEKDAAFLKDPLLNLSELIEGGRVSFLNAPKLLKDNELINAGGIPLRVIHTPGHSPGSICLYYKDIIFTGDTLFFDGIGRSDLPGSSEKELMCSIRDKLMVLPDKTRVYPGHGPDTTIDLERQTNFLMQ